MKGILLVLGIIVAFLIVGFGLHRIIKKESSVPVVSPSSFESIPSLESSSPPSPPPSPYVRCESFWARDGKIVGACGDGFIFEGPPDRISGKFVLYLRDRGTRI